MSRATDMTPTDTQVGDQWSELERLAKAATPGPWEFTGYQMVSRDLSLNYGTRIVLAAEEGTVYSEYSADSASLDVTQQDAAFIAAANPAAVLELIAAARSVGTSNASEPKPSQHPIRGEGEPDGWLMLDRNGAFLSMQPAPFHDGFQQMMERDCGATVQPLYAHPPTSEGEGLREKVAAAYIAGAMSVHEYWTENPGEAPRGDPEFDEAAHDYAYATLLSSVRNG